MPDVLAKGSLFDPTLVTDLINKVKGKSSLAVLSGQTPISFNGTKEFIFNMDNEIDIVAENGPKSHGGGSLTPVIINPIKFEYGMRVSDEFLYATEEAKVDILRGFNDGFARKVAKGLDIAAFHGFNPRTGAASAVVGSNHFDAAVSQTITYDATKPDDCIEQAIGLIEASEGEVNGIVISPTVRSDLSKLKSTSKEKLYPDFAFGGQPAAIGGSKLDVNSTVSLTADEAILGDFANMFKWGYSKEIPLEIIQYGDPDNSGHDLKGYNQVYIRSEIYLGWGILDADSFARVIKSA